MADCALVKFRYEILFVAVTGVLLGSVASAYYIWTQFPEPELLNGSWGELLGLPIFPPFISYVWEWQYGAYAPDVFSQSFFFVVIGAVVGTGGALCLSARKAQNDRSPVTHGSARFLSDDELEEVGLLEGRGVILGVDSKGRYLRHDGPEHVKVIAPTRSGKGVGLVIPTLLTWSESALVYDLKSEIWNTTAGYRSLFSHTIYFNPCDPASAHFNPLLEVRRGEAEVRDVQNIADMIVDPDGRGLTDHWAKTGHALLVGTILHVLYAEADKTLAGVARFLSNPDRTINETLHAMMHASHLSDGTTHPVVAAAAREMLNKAENERSGVLSTAMSFLSLYRDPVVARNTQDSDFRIMDLVTGERPVTLYLVVPPSDITRLRPLWRLIVNQICRRLTESLGDTTRRRLLMLLDEFPTLGRLEFFETALGFLAGYQIKCMLISQSTNQLEKTYGAKNSIIDNTHVRVVYAPNTIETAEMISRMLGQKTQLHAQWNFSGNRFAPWLSQASIANHETARALMTPGEVMELPHTDELVFIAGRPAIRAKKLRYFEDRNLSKRILPAPFLDENEPYFYGPRRTASEWNGMLASGKKINIEPELDVAINNYAI